jgi:hypothetical protein
LSTVFAAALPIPLLPPNTSTVFPLNAITTSELLIHTDDQQLTGRN